MKSLPRIGSQLVRFSVLAATLGANFGLAQSPDDPPIPKGPPAVLRSVKMISDAEGPALEIVSTRRPFPRFNSSTARPGWSSIFLTPKFSCRGSGSSGQRASNSRAHESVSAVAAGGPDRRRPGASRRLQQRRQRSAFAGAHASHGRGAAENRNALRVRFHQREQSRSSCRSAREAQAR